MFSSTFSFSNPQRRRSRFAYSKCRFHYDVTAAMWYSLPTYLLPDWSRYATWNMPPSSNHRPSTNTTALATRLLRHWWCDSGRSSLAGVHVYSVTVTRFAGIRLSAAVAEAAALAWAIRSGGKDPGIMLPFSDSAGQRCVCVCVCADRAVHGEREREGVIAISCKKRYM